MIIFEDFCRNKSIYAINLFYCMIDNKNADLNRFLKKIEETVKDMGYVSVNITGYANNEKNNPKTLQGTHINMRTYQNPEDFDFSKASEALCSIHSDVVRVRLKYREDNIEYNVDFPLKELPNHLKKLPETGVKENLKEEYQKKFGDLEK